MPLYVFTLMRQLPPLLSVCEGKGNATCLFFFISLPKEVLVHQHQYGSQKCANIIHFGSFFKESERLQDNCSPSSLVLLLLTEMLQGRTVQTICWFCFKFKHFHSQRDCFNLDFEAMFRSFLI